jgi:two-component system response regulator YesN
METPVAEIGSTFEALENCMESKFYYPDSRVFLQEEKEESGLFSKMDEDALSKQLKQDMKMKDISSLREHFETLCHRYRQNSSVSQAHIKFTFSNLLKEFYECLPTDKEQNLDHEIEELYNATEFEQVLAVINDNIDRLEKEFGYNPQMNHREIEAVKKYIYENYNKEISVDYLAEMVFMAPSYLSHVFKKETGQNLSKFIKAYRMEKAREMLEETHNKIVNISLEVGYPNVSYFCQSFREYFGVSPQKFRDQS